MALKPRNSSNVKFIKHSHKFEIDLGNDWSLTFVGDFVDVEKFSPVPGSLFQLRILTKGNSKFSFSLKNCGKGSVNIINFQVSSCRTGGMVERKNFTLLLDGEMVLPDLSIHIYEDVIFYTFQCNLEIEGSQFKDSILILCLYY